MSYLKTAMSGLKTAMSTPRIFLIALLLSTVASAAVPGAGPWRPGVPGFLLLAENRFDPSVQRFIAERSLKVLPLRNGQLYYVYPTDVDPQTEEMQIRYLEMLLDKRRASEPDPE